MSILTLKPQEIPFDAPGSCFRFQPSAAKPFVATREAISMYGQLVIAECLQRLQRLVREHEGVDYLQVFDCPDKPEPLWFIEDGEGGAITALLPSD
jgi:hypothetical protein